MPPLKELEENIINFEEEVEDIIISSVKELVDNEEFNEFLDLEKEPDNSDDDIVKAFDVILKKLSIIQDIGQTQNITSIHALVNGLTTHINAIHRNQLTISTNLTDQHDKILKSQKETNFFLKHFKKVMFIITLIVATNFYSLGVTQHENIKPYFEKIFTRIIR